MFVGYLKSPACKEWVWELNVCWVSELNLHARSGYWGQVFAGCLKSPVCKEWILGAGVCWVSEVSCMQRMGMGGICLLGIRTHPACKEWILGAGVCWVSELTPHAISGYQRQVFAGYLNSLRMQENG